MRAAHILFLLVAVSGTSLAQQPLTEHERILHVLNRLSFGADDDAVRQVEELGLDAWIAKQLDTTTLDAGTRKRLAGYTSLELDCKGIYASFGDKAAELDRELLGALILRAVYAEGQAAEVMADFWRNHFSVDRSKDSVRFTATEWDREVIRRHVFGSFGPFLMATAKHPSMLVYLDNHISRRPPTKTELKTVARNVRRETGSKDRGDEAADIAAQRGINENYARELMELHTLGVDNGYEQRDVIDLARALTGWTISTKDREYIFEYVESMHDGGDKFVLGRSFAREKKRNGILEGERIIEYLAGHPETAGFLARKLCIRLVADEPPQSLVDSTALELRRSDFDLKRAVLHIVGSEEFFERKHYRAKFKTPIEFVFSALRAVDAEIEDPKALIGIIKEMGQGLYDCEDPTGWDDRAEAWRDPGVMAVRWKFAMDLARNRIDGVKVPESFLAEVEGQYPHKAIVVLGRRVLAGELRPETITALLRMSQRHRDLEKKLEKERLEALVQGKKAKRVELPSLHALLLGTLLGSPEFQEQ